MHWEHEADARARALLEDFGKELSEEAERVARRLRAGAVSADYVNEAASTIRLRRPSGAWADLLLAVGIGLLGIAGGVLAVVLTASAPIKLGWVESFSISMACLGFFLAGVGGTLKIRQS